MNFQELYDIFDDIVYVRLMFEDRDLREKPSYELIKNVGELELPKEKEFDDMMSIILRKYNSLLPHILKKLNIKQFIPYHNSTYEMKDGYLEICYHHNRNLYEICYNDPLCVIVPDKIEQLQVVYNTYLLTGWSD